MKHQFRNTNTLILALARVRFDTLIARYCCIYAYSSILPILVKSHRGLLSVLLPLLACLVDSPVLSQWHLNGGKAVIIPKATTLGSLLNTTGQTMHIIRESQTHKVWVNFDLCIYFYIHYAV